MPTATSAAPSAPRTLDIATEFSHRPVSPLTPNGTRELVCLGLGVDDLRWYCDQFVGHPFDFAQRGPRSTGWPRVCGPALGATRIVGHLAGRYALATNARKDETRGRCGQCWTPYIVVDLDHGDDKRQRLRAVIRALGAPSFVVQSSESRGLHVYYMLRTPCALYRLRDDKGARGAVLTLLAAAGMPEKAGRVEVYPRGATRAFGQQNPLRLPFGPGCVLLDSDPAQLLPMHAGDGWPARREDLRFVRAGLEAGRLPMADAGRWISEAGTQPIARRGRSTQRKLNRDASAIGAGASAEAARWLVDGLTEPGQLNTALKACAKHLRYRRQTEDETRADLHRWLDRSHNGYSRTMNASGQRAHAMVDAVVAWVYRFGPYTARGALPALSTYEATRILRSTDHPVVCRDPLTGEVLNSAKLRRFVFAAYRFGKQWALDRGNALWHEAAGESEVASAATRQRVVTAARAFWPDPSQAEFVVDQPWRLWARLKLEAHPLLKTVSRDSIPKYKRAATALGLLTIERQSTIGRCEAFRMHLDFGALSASKRAILTAEDALEALMDRGLPSHPPRRGRSAWEPRVCSLKMTSADGPNSTASPFVRLVVKHLRARQGRSTRMVR